MEYSFSTDAGFAEVHLTGQSEPGCFREIFDALEENASWRPGMPLLIDKTEYDTSRLTVGDVHVIARTCSDRKDIVGRSRIAVLVARDIEYGMNRMFEVFVRWDADFGLFREREAAVDWVCGRVAV